jgi:hypothetical protein
MHSEPTFSKSMGAHPAAPETEIEITPAMVDAGVDILVAQYDAVGGLVDRAAAIEIFKAMMAKKVL